MNLVMSKFKQKLNSHSHCVQSALVLSFSPHYPYCGTQAKISAPIWNNEEAKK